MNARSTPHSTFLRNRLRDERVSFVGDAIIRSSINNITIRFIIIRNRIFRTNDRTILLRTPSVKQRRLSNRVEILARVLRITSIRQYTMSVSAKTRRSKLITMTYLFASTLSMGRERFKIPNYHRANRNERDRTKIINTSNLFPLIPRRVKACTIKTIIHPCVKGTRAKRAHATRLTLHVNRLRFLFRNRATWNIFRSFFGEFTYIRVSKLLLNQGERHSDNRGRARWCFFRYYVVGLLCGWTVVVDPCR